MQTFNVLVVDDKPWPLDRAKALAERWRNLNIIAAANLNEAKTAIQKNFLHMAFVDVQLDKDDSNKDGINLIEYLSQHRPACRRFIITATLRTHWRDVVKVAHLLHGIYVTIELADQYFVDAIEKYYTEWISRDVHVDIRPPVDPDFFSRVMADLRRERDEKNLKSEKIYSTSAELDYLVARVFGQGDHIGDWDTADIHKVDLQQVPKGKSGSVVLKAVPSTGTGREAIVSVIKVGTISHARREFVNYRRFVRFGRRHDRHVELLGYEFADTLGLLCYSFAGPVKDPDVTDLEGLLRRKSPNAASVIRRLFDPAEADFYKMDVQPKSLADYFASAYPGRTSARAIDAIDEFLTNLRRKSTGNGGSAEADFHPVTRSLEKAVFHDPVPWVVIHGDLHAGNVFPGSRMNAPATAGSKGTLDLREVLKMPLEQCEAAILIDYFFTGPGPRCLDFAAMESSVRLVTLDEAFQFSEVFARREAERLVWQAIWGGSAGEKSKTVCSGSGAIQSTGKPCPS